MKCPLLCIGDRRVQLGEETEYGECLQEECAWWNSTLVECVVLGASNTLISGVIVLQALVQRMPHSGQFTK